MSEPTLAENLISAAAWLKYWILASLHAWTETEYTPQNAVALTVSGGATPSNTSAAIDISDAQLLALQVRNGNSTSLNVYVYASPDDSVYDDQSYASMNLGANQEKTLLIAVGPNYVKVTVTNADAANTTTVTSKLSKKS